MEDELFRLSILRAADERTLKTPIVVEVLPAPPPMPPDVTLAPAAHALAAWLGSKDLSLETIGHARSFVHEQFKEENLIDRSLLAGVRSFACLEFVAALRSLRLNPNADGRPAINARGEFLTACAMLAEFETTPSKMRLSDWIKTHPITFDPLLVFPGVSWLPFKGLSRPAAVCQHFVVRDRLLGYETGEIVDIKNFMKGEAKKHTLRHLTVREEESTSESETENERTLDTATQQRSALRTATQRTANDTLGVDARVKTDGKYGPTQVSTDIGFQYSSGHTEAQQVAAEMSTDVLQRSVERVRTRELERRVQRTRDEIEEFQSHNVDNSKGKAHVVGIYRWLDSVWEATTYDVGRRLVLEFLIPQPGLVLFNIAAGRQALSESAERPDPLPHALFDDLDEAMAGRFAANLGISGLKAKPAASVTVSTGFQADEIADQPKSRIQSKIVSDLKVPDGYVGTKVRVTVTSMTRAGPDAGVDLLVTAPQSLPAANVNPTKVSSNDAKDFDTWQYEFDASCAAGSIVPISVYSEDYRGFSGIVEVDCDVLEATLINWKFDTIEKIAAAQAAAVSAWEAKSTSRKLFNDDPPAAPADIEAMLRHSCVSALLGGMPLSKDRHDGLAGWPRPDGFSGSDGQMVLFLEQAFEWAYLQYVAYPYYWADDDQWGKLLQVDDPSPKVREFLRSGAVRVVLPVRPEMTESVLFFLGTGISWFGGPAPIPGDAQYLSISEEIRDARAETPSGTVVGDPYRFHLPTALTILDMDGTLPAIPPLVLDEP